MCGAILAEKTAGILQRQITIYFTIWRADFIPLKFEGVADWMKSQENSNAEEWWTLSWRDDSLAPQPITNLAKWHHFTDADVSFWRSGWDAQADQRVAFKCGPPEGHAAKELSVNFPDWRLEDGHVHPDVNSFILWAHGQYLTGVSGCARRAENG